MRPSLVVTALLVAATAHAQQPPPQESAAPPPPALRLEGLIPLDVPGAVDVRWGVDPQSIQVTPEGIVRYVAVAQSGSGAVNAFYESLRCSSAEVKVHARRGRDGDWVRTSENERWRPIRDGRANRHSLAIASAGACVGPIPSGDTAQVVREMRRTGNGRFTDQSR